MLVAIKRDDTRTCLGGAAESVDTRLTYHCWVNEGTPTAFFLEKSEHKGYDGGTEKDDNELVLELLEDELPDGGGWLFGNGCTT